MVFAACTILVILFFFNAGRFYSQHDCYGLNLLLLLSLPKPVSEASTLLTIAWLPTDHE